MRLFMQYFLGRGRFPSPETVRRHIRFLKPLGVDGFLFALRSSVENSVFPAVAPVITKEYLREIDCILERERMEFIPKIQIMGHHQKLLARPEMEPFREHPKGGDCFRITSGKFREKIKSYLGEIAGLFHSEWIHCGCDEAFALGTGESRRILEQNGFEEGVAEYLNEINSCIRGRNKKMVIYADELVFYPKIRELLDRDIILVTWGYGRIGESYELENHHYKAHGFVTAKHRNWVTGNCMAEYGAIPLKRLDENVAILKKLALESSAEAFVVSDWGNNAESYTFSLAGALYIARKLSGSGCGEEAFLNELSSLVLGRDDEAFKEASKIMFGVNDSLRYWTQTLLKRGPVFQRLYYQESDSLSFLRICASVSMEKFKLFLEDMHRAEALLNRVQLGKEDRGPVFFRDFKALANRLAAGALRGVIGSRYVWSTGSMWHGAEDFIQTRKEFEEYGRRVRSDMENTLSIRDRDCLPGNREECETLFRGLLDSTEKMRREPENSLLYFEPREKLRSSTGEPLAKYRLEDCEMKENVTLF